MPVSGVKALCTHQDTCEHCVNCAASRLWSQLSLFTQSPQPRLQRVHGTRVLWMGGRDTHSRALLGSKATGFEGGGWAASPAWLLPACGAPHLLLLADPQHPGVLSALTPRMSHPPRHGTSRVGLSFKMMPVHTPRSHAYTLCVGDRAPLSWGVFIV